MITLGAGEKAITSMGNDPIVAFVFDVKGLGGNQLYAGATWNIGRIW